MKFAHIADCHIGGWRDPKLKELVTKAFVKSIDTCISEDVNFVLISGDLFNTSVPSIDGLGVVVGKIKELKDHGKEVYIVPGSHDFSPSGKTMIDVLEKAGLLTKVTKGKVEGEKLHLRFTIDKNSGAKITGLLGKRGTLERSYYESLDKGNLEKEDGFKIFMFHSAVNELKSEELEKMSSIPISFMPKGFDYYAGGHVHSVQKEKMEGYGWVVFPGPLFPNSFSEIEKLKGGGFFIYDTEIGEPEYKNVNVCNVHCINIDADGKTPENVYDELSKIIKSREFIDTIVTIRISGKLSRGKPSEIDLKEIAKKLYERSAYFVMKNTVKLTSSEYEEIMVKEDSTDNIEDSLINEHIGQIEVEGLDEKKEKMLTKEIMHKLDIEKEEGEKQYDFESRISKEIDKMLDIE